MHYVYFLKSESNPEQKYVGVTSNLKSRLAEHNSGKSKHTSKFQPWILVTYIAFSDKYKAFEFEKYIQEHSGRAFAN